MLGRTTKNKAVITSLAVVGAIGLIGIASVSWATVANSSNSNNSSNTHNGSADAPNNSGITNNDTTHVSISKPTQDQVTAQKLATVQKMYQLSSQLGVGSEVLLSQFASDELKEALALEQQVMDQEGLMCGIGADIMWQSQDPDYHEPVTFSLTEDGKVKVLIADREELVYELSCTGERCLIEDIYDFAGSIKQSLLENCQ